MFIKLPPRGHKNPLASGMKQFAIEKIQTDESRKIRKERNLKIEKYKISKRHKLKNTNKLEK